MLIIDPDMVLRDSLAAWGWQYGAAPGWAVSVFFGYMVGTHNNLSDTHIPEIPRRNDTIAGEQHGGRRALQGGSVSILGACLRRAGG